MTPDLMDRLTAWAAGTATFVLASAIVIFALGGCSSPPLLGGPRADAAVGLIDWTTAIDRGMTVDPGYALVVRDREGNVLLASRHADLR